MKKYNILFCPTHYVISNKSGSEFIWSYKIFSNLSKQFSSCIFITGGSQNLDPKIINLNIFKSSKINLKLFNVIKFHLYSQIIGFKYLLNSKILFHVLPFSLGTSINFLFLIPFVKVKKVIGPLQLPLKVLDTDLDISDARGFKKSTTSINLLSLLIKKIKPILYYLNLLMLKRSDLIIAISKDVKKELVTRGISREKIKIIPVGIDISAFPIKKEISKNNQFTIISTSYLLKRKNIDQIIHALKMLIDNNYNVRLLIVGDGPQKDELVRLTEELKLKEYIEFVGFIDNSKIVNYYNKSHCFVSMSSSESWGQVYLEAMSCGLPIISSLNDGSKVIIKNDETGFLVNQNDTNMLYNRLVELITNNDKYIKMSKKARYTVEKNYDWQTVIIPQYIKFIEKLLDERNITNKNAN